MNIALRNIVTAASTYITSLQGKGTTTANDCTEHSHKLWVEALVQMEELQMRGGKSTTMAEDHYTKLSETEKTIGVLLQDLRERGVVRCTIEKDFENGRNNDKKI